MSSMNTRRRTHRNAAAVTALTAAVGICLLPATAQAVDGTWTAAGGGLFNVPGNWNGGAGPVPGAGDDATWNLAGTYTTTFNVSQTNNAAFVLGGNVTWQPSVISTYSLSGMEVNGASLTIAPGVGAAALTVSAPGVDGLYLNAGAIMTVSGANNHFNCGICHDGSFVPTPPSSLNIINGASFTSDGFELAGDLNITDATASIGVLFDFGGEIHFNSGSLSYEGPLSVGAGGLLGTNLTLASNRSLSLIGATTVNAGSTLTLDGGTLNTNNLTSNGITRFNGGVLGITGGGSVTVGSAGSLIVDDALLNISGAVTNNGEIRLMGAVAQITASGTLTNNKLITGDGRIAAALSNPAAGEVRVTSGQRLFFSGGSATNAGQINLLGGTTEFNATLANNAGGTISGRGTLSAHGGVTNAGNIQLSSGTSDIFGALTNNSGGKTIVSGNALATFYNAVTNNAGAEFRVSSGSTAVFFGDVTNNGSFTGTGTKQFEAGSTGVLGMVAGGGTTIVASGANVSAAVVREAALNIDGNMALTTDGGTTRVGSLAVGSGGLLDLANNKLIVAGGDVGTASGNVYSGLTGRIQTAYNFGGWDGGEGIKTSELAAVDGLTTIAIAPADDTPFAGGTFGGVTVTSGDVLFMYTYAGDANLDGTIDGGDYGVIDNFVQVPGAFGYAKGDFNYDGVIDGGDYGIIDNNIQAQGAPFPTSAAGLSGVTAVPEPAAVGLMVLCGGVLEVRNRRRFRR